MLRLVAFGCGILILLAGCTTMKRVSDNSESYLSQSVLELPEETGTKSLFASDEAVLGGDTIEKILSAKISIPPKSRLAVIRFSQSRYIWWSDEFMQMDQTIQGGFIEQLGKSPRLANVSLLPSLITPEKKTIPYLREAAARYQADLLLVYGSGNRFYTKSKMFRPEEVKATCIVEAILLDVRTGIVPFTAVSYQQYTIAKTKGDYGLEETYAKAEMNSVSKALKEICEKLVKYLETAP